MTAKKKWQNWSGIVKFSPEKVYFPTSESEIMKVVKKCAAKNRKIRIIGSAHSWNPLFETQMALVSLDKYQGIESIDFEKMQATVYAGTKIKYLGELLHENGLAMENLGDIDVQSIAGAIGTGTHGTGINLGIIPTQVVGLSLVTASGEVLECSAEKNPHIFKAAQLSLGTLGIISKITLQCVPAYKLHFVSNKENFSSCLNNLEEYIANNRNYEFYWFPHTETVQNKFSNISQEAVKPYTKANYLNDLVLENMLFGAISSMTRVVPSMSASVAKLSANLVGETNKLDWSHKVYATPRLVKFNEMEYNVPIESFKDVCEEIAECVRQKHFKVHFPTENRFIKGDDIYLSPCYGRDSAHISVHVFKGKPYKEYFAALESIFRNHNGRPHWGKLHTLTADDLCELYPKWEDFGNIRRKLDPTNLFLNGYLQNLLER